MLSHLQLNTTAYISELNLLPDHDMKQKIALNILTYKTPESIHIKSTQGSKYLLNGGVLVLWLF